MKEKIQGQLTEKRQNFFRLPAFATQSQISAAESAVDGCVGFEEGLMFMKISSILYSRGLSTFLPNRFSVCLRWLCVPVASFLFFTHSALALGLMVPRDGSQPLALVHHHVQVQVHERGATTRVEQIFSNPNANPVEAVYFFPLPVDATVDEFALWMKGQRQVGKVLPKAEARRIYESIVRATRDPGLIEYVDAQLFQARVFPIPPRGEQKVELTYTHLVPYEAGTHRYVYPLRTDQKAATTLRDFVFAVQIEGKMPIQNLYSPTHRIAQKVSGTRASVSFEKTEFSLEDDFRLYWHVADQEVGVTLLTHQEEDEAGYFLLMASPQDAYRQKQAVGKRISFVIDTSGSMAGEKLKALKSALAYGIQGLGEDDLFQVIAFGGHVERFAERMVAANERNKRAALDFVRMLDAVGGTPIDEALQLALSSATGSKKIQHQIVMVTDGRPTIGETDAAKIRAGVSSHTAAGVRIFALGVGDDVNPSLLDALAEENHGRSVYLRGDAAVEEELRAFFDRIRYPVLLDINWQIRQKNPAGAATMRFFQSLPEKKGDLFYGEQLLVLGRFVGEGPAQLTVGAKTPRGIRTFQYPVVIQNGDHGHGFLPRLWAQREVARMMGEIRARGENPALVEELRQMALRFGIVTPYTSYLVVEKGVESVGSPAPVDLFPMPSPLPRPRGTRKASRVSGAAAESGFREDSTAARGALPEAEAWHAQAGRASLRAQSGADAVRMAKEMKKLKEGILGPKSTMPRGEIFAAGRRFVRDGDALVDTKSQTDDEVLRIQCYSDVYFYLLRLRPKLRSVLRLAERIRLQIRPGRTIWIDRVPSEVNEAELDAFVAAE